MITALTVLITLQFVALAYLVYVQHRPPQGRAESLTRVALRVEQPEYTRMVGAFEQMVGLFDKVQEKLRTELKYPDQEQMISLLQTQLSLQMEIRNLLDDIDAITSRTYEQQYGKKK